MEPTRITATELARNLSDVLSRVRYRGESFRVERNGEVMGLLEPPPPNSRFTVQDLVELLRDLPPPDDQFSRDLCEIRESQGALPTPAWDS